MTTRDMGTLLSEALHVESDDASISDPHTAVLELQRAIQRNRRRRTPVAF